MKRKAIVFAAVLFLCATYSYAQECDGWKGTWEVKKADGSTVQWMIDKSTSDTGSSFLLCKASGKEKAPGKPDIDIQIIWVSFANAYMYYQGAAAPGMSSPCSELGNFNTTKDAFTATGPKDLGIVSGKKITVPASAAPAAQPGK